MKEKHKIHISEATVIKQLSEAYQEFLNLLPSNLSYRNLQIFCFPSGSGFQATSQFCKAFESYN
jgi:hypothetical protein